MKDETGFTPGEGALSFGVAVKEPSIPNTGWCCT